MNKNFLQLKDINKTYKDGYIACDNINLSINKGEFVTILGPSGCGKTTILKMIAGFETPTKGKILVNGIDIKNLSIDQRPTATVFQDYALFPNLNVNENIQYGLKMMRKKINDVHPKIFKERDKTVKLATKKAITEIHDIQKEQRKIDVELAKLRKKYQKNISISLLEKMRYSQFNSEIKKLNAKMKKKYGENTEFNLSLKNKWLLTQNKLLRFLRIVNKPVEFDITNMNEFQILIADLLKYYIYKTPFDKKIDLLSNKYNELDQEISYWSNYTSLEKERFEKKHTTRPLTKIEISKKSKQVIKLVGLEGNEYKYPVDLSGGMQQRVALARAIVIQPDILLLDEPLSALDAKVRSQMQQELKRLHNELGLTFILVTHDQQEALSLSDKVVVMSKGKIEQIDKPKNIYEKPANEWIANFIGKANLFDVIFLENDTFLIDNKQFIIEHDLVKLKIKSNSNLFMMLRPEDIQICDVHDSYFNGEIKAITYHGTFFEIKCLIEKKVYRIETTENLKIGDTIGLKWNWKYAHFIQNKGVK